MFSLFASLFAHREIRHMEGLLVWTTLQPHLRLFAQAQAVLFHFSERFTALIASASPYDYGCTCLDISRLFKPRLHDRFSPAMEDLLPVTRARKLAIENWSQNLGLIPVLTYLSGVAAVGGVGVLHPRKFSLSANLQ